MKFRTMCITGMALLTVVVTVRLAAQGRPQSEKKEHIRYKLIDIGTFGGPNSGNNGESTVMNGQGDVVGFADTTTPDPFDPICFGDCLVQHAFEWRKGVLTDLGAVPGGYSSSTNAINSQEQVAGFSQNGLIDPATGIPEFVAAVWQDGRVTNLGTFGGSFSIATMNNDRQQVVGCAFNDIPDSFTPTGIFYGLGFGPQQLRAFRWQGKKLHDLGTLGGADACAVWINQGGQITGASFTNSVVDPNTGLPTLDPFLWVDGKMVDIGTLGGTVGLGFMVNNRGQVIGISSLAEAPGACITGPFFGTPGCHGILWDRGILKDLGTLGGDFSIANWINEEGEIAGVASTPGEQTVHGTLWKNGVITDLGTLPGDCASQAFAINSKGQIVGQSFPCDSSPPRAAVWERDGTVHDLNALVKQGSGLELTDPKIINDADDIVLEGLLSNGDAHSVVLIPCDEKHPGIEGCEFDPVEASTEAQVRPAQITRAPAAASATKLSPAEMMTRFRTAMSNRNRRFGSLAPK
jgi:probable HAF family extracellular repeat protein